MLTATFAEVPSSLAGTVADDNELVREILDGRKGKRISIHDAWPALHFTLTGELPIPREEALRRGIDFPNDPLEAILMGGLPTGVHTEFGPARFVSVGEVRQGAEMLTSVSDVDFEDWFDADDLEEERIPPAGWTSDADRLPRLVEALRDVRDFYVRAARDGNAILIAFE
ncbi:DUF1877 family protein [Streptomyces sp. NPDC050788]|jgi:hypothetical protein|uniref:DUF1877 family protein n=1 Tax=Streptomyces sp. NPDC050788 TaxID=3155041 RepID=UPI0034132933